MVFAECGACHRGIRVWDVSRGGAAPVRAASAPLSAATDGDRRWTCPSCGHLQTLPTASAYAIWDRERREVRYVGSSVDAQRRIDLWEGPSTPHGDPANHRGVQLATPTGLLPEPAWFAAPEAEE